MPAKSQRLHPPPVPWLLAAQGFSGVLPPGRVEVGVVQWGLCRARGIPTGGISVGGIGAAHAAAHPGSRGGGMGKPRFWVSRRHRKCAGMASCPLLSHSTVMPKLGQSWELWQVFSPVMAAEGTCPWWGGTHWEHWEHWMWGHRPLPLVPFCPQTATLPEHHTEGRGGTMLVAWGTGDTADVGSGSATLCLSLEATSSVLTPLELSMSLIPAGTDTTQEGFEECGAMGPPLPALVPGGFVTCGAGLCASSVLPVFTTSHNDVTLLSPHCTPTPDLGVPEAMPCVPSPCCGCPGSCFRLVHLHVEQAGLSSAPFSRHRSWSPLSNPGKMWDKHLPEAGGAELHPSVICQLSPQISAAGGRAPFLSQPLPKHLRVLLSKLAPKSTCSPLIGGESLRTWLGRKAPAPRGCCHALSGWTDPS